MLRIIGLEFRKSFCRRSVFIALIILSILNLWKIWDGYQASSYLAGGKKSAVYLVEAKDLSGAYWRLYDVYGGAITKEKVNKLSDWYNKVCSASQGEIPLSSVNLITENIFDDWVLAQHYYASPMQNFISYSDEAKAVADKAKENYNLYTKLGNSYDVKKNALIFHLYRGRSISDFAYTECYDAFTDYQFSIVMALFLCLYGIVHVFIPEKETQMGMLLLTSINGGRKLKWAKIIAATAYIAGVTLWFYMLDAGSFVLVYGTTEGGALPLYALAGFDSAAVNWSVLKYAVIAGVYRILGMWSFCMILLLLTEFFQNALLPFIGSMVVAVIMVLAGYSFAYSSNIWFKVINPYSMLRSSVLFSQTDFVNVFGIPVPSYQAGPFTAAAVGLAAIALIFVCEKRNVHMKKGGKHANLSV